MKKKLYGTHASGEVVEVEVMGVVDSATWNEYASDERESYIDKDKEQEEKLKEQWVKYTARERKQRKELNAVNIKFHTALAEIKEHLGGKGDIVIHIGKDALVLVPNEQYVDADAINKKYRTTNAEEKRGINRMKAIIGYYRRKTRIEKSLARTMYYMTKKAAEYEEKTDEMLSDIIVMDGELEKLKAEMVEAKQKYQNIEKNKAKATVQYKNYKVDKNSIHVGYRKQRGYDYLAFSNYKEYSDYERLWYEDRKLTNWRMRDYKRVKPKTDVKPILLLTFPTTVQDTVQNPPKRRGRPKGSKNKKKIAASA